MILSVEHNINEEKCWSVSQNLFSMQQYLSIMLQFCIDLVGNSMHIVYY